MKTAFEKMMAGLEEVEAFLAGDSKGFKVHVPERVDVKTIRTRLGLTQSRFSRTFGFSLDAVKNWECQRRQPEAAARILLTVIEHDPAAVIAALHPEVARSGAGKQRQVAYTRAKQYIRQASKHRHQSKHLQAAG